MVMNLALKDNDSAVVALVPSDSNSIQAVSSTVTQVERMWGDAYLGAGPPRRE